MTDPMDDGRRHLSADVPGAADRRDSAAGGPSTAGRTLRRIGLVLLGIVLYTISMNMYSGYPEVGSQWINRAAILALVVFAAVVFIRDERRQARENRDDHHDDAA